MEKIVKLLYSILISARRREGRSAAELGTGVAAERLVAHVTQPTLWEPGVT